MPKPAVHVDRFLGDLQVKAACLAELFGMDSERAEDLAQALAISLSADWRGTWVYLDSAPYVDSKRAAVYVRWRRVREQERISEHAAEQVAREMNVSARTVYRIVREVEAGRQVA